MLNSNIELVLHSFLLGEELRDLLVSFLCPPNFCCFCRSRSGIENGTWNGTFSSFILYHSDCTLIVYIFYFVSLYGKYVHL